MSGGGQVNPGGSSKQTLTPVSYTHLRAHETVLDLVCRLLLEKKNKKTEEKKKKTQSHSQDAIVRRLIEV